MVPNENALTFAPGDASALAAQLTHLKEDSELPPRLVAQGQATARSLSIDSIPDAAIEKHLELGRALPTWKSTMHLYPSDGAAARVPEGDTAWPTRDVKWVQVMVGVDPDPANAGVIRDWAVSYSEAISPYAMNSGYVNMIMDDGQERVRAMYGDKFERLARIKAQYDPENVFRVNQNIAPAA